MKRIAYLLVCVACLATVASANDIRIFFGQPEFVPPVEDFVPEAHWGESAPPGTYMLGIWAEIQMDFSGPFPAMDVWNGIAVNITSAGPVTVSDLTMDNFNHRLAAGPAAYRWDSSSDFGTGSHFSLVGLTEYGLGGLYPPELGAGDGATDWWSHTIGEPGEPDARYRYWLGNVTLASPGPAEVWFEPGPGGITRLGGDPDLDHVYFGETDPMWWTPIPPDPGGYEPDFVFTPEPAGLLLMAVAGCLLRRR
jgi:hypothetical protein